MNANQATYQRLVDSLAKNSKKQNWDFVYDRELDNFYFIPKKLPKTARLYNLNDEIALYLDSNKDVVGVMIEYFSSNFIQHNKDYKEVIDLMQKTKTMAKPKKTSKTKAEVYKKSLVGDILQQMATG